MASRSEAGAFILRSLRPSPGVESTKTLRAFSRQSINASVLNGFRRRQIAPVAAA